MHNPKEPEKQLSKTDILKEEIQTDVRQSLALERTVMANERTLMSYLRTALAIAAAGLTIQHFSNSVWLVWVGYALIPAGLVMGISGWLFYRRRRNQIDQDKQLLSLRIFKRRKNFF